MPETKYHICMNQLISSRVIEGRLYARLYCNLNEENVTLSKCIKCNKLIELYSRNE